MKPIQTHIPPTSDSFIKNKSKNERLLDDFFTKLEHNYTFNHTEKLNSSTKLLPRERIDLLIDPNSAFLELSSLAAIDQYNNQFPAAGLITGIGTIHGNKTMIVANDYTVKGGTYIKETIKKHLRAQEIAEENNLPCVYIVDSGGIFLPEQSSVFPDKEGFGRIFYNQARLSAKGIAQISIVTGSCTAGGAYIPAMSDETIMVKGQATIFLAGPPLVKAATGEEITSEELGGADVHTSISGVADHLAENEHEAMELCRSLFESLSNGKTNYENSAKKPRYESNELIDLMGTQSNAYEIIARIVDDSAFQEFKPNYGKTLITGFAKIENCTVGIIANNGILFSESALKGTHFIELCNSRKTPMIFLHNINGFMVGKEYEHKGIAKDGAKMVHALANSTVPFFTIITGGSYGAGNYAMAGRAFNPRFLFLWPNASTSVMGPSQAAEVLVSLKRKQTANHPEQLAQVKQEILERYQAEASPYFSTSRLWDDGIINPAETRNILALCLSITSTVPIEDVKYGIFRM